MQCLRTSRGFATPRHGPTGYTLPATQHDIVIWIAGAGYDVVFDLSRQVVKALAGDAVLTHEMVGWPYHHDRDLTGFIDGTENPSLVDAMAVAIVPEGSPGEGGSVLLLQQWEHDVMAWEGLSTEAQEAVEIRAPQEARQHRATTSRRQDRTSRGPTRSGSGRSSGATSRTARSPITGRSSSVFSATQQVLDGMLGQHDRTTGEPADELTHFTRPITGAYYVVPSADRLASLAAS